MLQSLCGITILIQLCLFKKKIILTYIIVCYVNSIWLRPLTLMEQHSNETEKAPF